MPSKTPEVPLRDIHDNIRLAQSFVEGFSLGRFKADLRTIYAVIRCLEIISEASRRLPASVKNRHPAIPWKEIAGAGNVYRHDYEEVSAVKVWNTVKALPVLLAAVEQEIERAARKPAKRRPRR
jgi:uncharacterized protein with HEPN domain